MSDGVSPVHGDGVSLDDRWTVESGRIIISGTQAIARALLDQITLDRWNGLRTGGYVSGYRGSPLGQVDSVLWSIGERLQDAGIVFQPGVNEEIAATAVRGTQQLEAVPDPKVEGVFAAWYGKGPGVDRAGDAFKHGNYAGTHPKGGVLIFYGDDHAAKSSTIAHHSEQAVSASNIPSFYPSDAGEIRLFALLGIALSRFSGSWVGLKCVTEVVEQTASVDVDLPTFKPALPDRPEIKGLHIGGTVFDPLGEERVVVEERLPLVHAFVRANGIDRTVMDASRRRVGIVTAGKAYGDVRAALRLLGLDDARCVELGISLYKAGMIWPLEPEGMRAFARGHDLLFVVEEKAPFLEPQVCAILINEAKRPLVVGKADLAGERLLSSVASLEPVDIAKSLARLLASQGIEISCELGVSADALSLSYKRSPYFCSGCPHNRSTRIPDGSLSMTGIGCHTMVNFVRPQEALLPVQMGGEGGNWIGLAAFTGTRHIFQNLGDGTYYHSGLLSIRAAVAAGVNITYKILFNDAVAMTGGQPVDGPLTVPAIVQQVLHEGVAKAVIVSDDPGKYRSLSSAGEVEVFHRDDLDAVQRDLREVPGCTVLVYEQTCAAEKRRRRKRREMPDPPRRMFIAKEVCEGCGDCSEMSTCVSLQPVETAFGVKREIDQSSCNKDYSCADGFCPSFLTIHGAEPVKPERALLDERLFAALPPPERAPIGEDSFNLMIAGIGGTGVVTVGAVIGMAAHIEGLAISTFDMMGVSQKNGAVYSHVKIARDPSALSNARISLGEADTLLAFDMVASLSADSLGGLSSRRTRAVVNNHVTPTAAFQFDRDLRFSRDKLVRLLEDRIVPGAMSQADAKTIAERLLGDTIGANMFMVGVALQSGMLPVGLDALERAIRLNGVAVDFNLDALRLGRLFAVDSEAVLALARPSESSVATPRTLDEIMAHRADHLLAYQGPALRDRYLGMVGRVRDIAGDGPIAAAVARNYAKLLAYKDEYEVARLLTQPALHDDLARMFGGRGRIELNLAPPLLPGRGRMGRPRKRAFSARLLPLLRMLARLRGLRGTMFDPFGWTSERKMERALIGEYEHLVEQVLSGLQEGNHAHAAALLELADIIRGFGPVKEAAVAEYREKIDGELERYLSGSSGGAAPRKSPLGKNETAAELLAVETGS